MTSDMLCRELKIKINIIFFGSKILLKMYLTNVLIMSLYFNKSNVKLHRCVESTEASKLVSFLKPN